MKKRNMLRKMICLVLTAVMVIQYVPFQSNASASAQANETTKEGMEFNQNTLVRTIYPYSKAIATFEATVKFAADSTGKGGVIIGNYKRAGESCYSFEIDENGAPRLYLVGNATFDYRFTSVNVYTGERLHLAVVHDLSSAQVSCYVNGTLKQTLSTDANDTAAIIPSNVVCVGSDLRATNDNYCRGEILNVKVYSDVRSASEIAADVNTLSTEEIIAYYDLSNATSNDDYISDGSGKGNDLYPLVWLDERPSIDAYDFSMKVIGDTQIVTQEYGQSLSKIYDYVLDTAEEHNTQFVVGVGDIVNQNTDAQWSVAKEQISRMDGVLRYSLVRGNHDTQYRINSNFPYSEFKTMMQTNYPGNEFGAYNEQEIQNTWQELTVGSLKYLIFALDSGASDEVLAWASEIIKAHPEHRVIVTTHVYLCEDGSTLDAQDASAPTNWVDHNQVAGITNNNGDHMWEEFVQHHENIQMVFCGHIDVDDVVVNQSEGLHGNVVTAMMFNPQGMDAQIEGGTGMVATLYFSQGGNKVQVEYYSPIRNQWLVSMPQESLDLNSEAEVYVDEADIAEYTTVKSGKVTRTVPHLDKEGYEDYVFAGWYRDFACTIPVGKSVTTGQFFAKYLPADTFSVKFQTTKDFSEEDSTAKLRMVSTVDNLKYSAVGFDIVYRAGEAEEEAIAHNTQTVYPKIEANENGVDYQYSPNIFDLNSEYFVTATLVGIGQADYDKAIKVTPYVVTKDGTKSTGTARYVRMEDVYMDMINVPVTVNNIVEEQSGTIKLSYNQTLFTYEGLFDQGDFGTTTVTDNKNGTISITSKNVEGRGVIANLRFKKNSNAIIPKETTFDVLEENFEGTIVSPKHLEYAADYQGVVDTSWYNETDRAFVITNPAELYGVAELSNTTTDFSNQKIYLGADIVVNDGTVEEWLADGFDKNSLHKWEQSIGTNVWGRRFDGTFDGQGHAIQGIYSVKEEANKGFFGTIASNAVIRNLRLENSYVYNTYHTTGGVVGLANGGDIINVYSGVQLETVDHTGGVVGRTNTVNEVDIIGCWYDGKITLTGKGAGGIVGTAFGHSQGSTTRGPQPVTISDCLYTGTIASTHTNPAIGGILGRTDSAYCAEVDIDNCISDGEITITSSETSQMGSFIGSIATNTNVYADNSFATIETYGSRREDMVGTDTLLQGNGLSYVAREFMTGYLGYTLVSTAENAKLWVARDGQAPAPAMLADGLDMKDAIVADTSWYNEGKRTHTIMDEEDLYGFAKLSLTNQFVGHTIVLGNDITINDTTDYASWATNAPKIGWMPIGVNNPFAGTFGGADENSIHAIRGLYLKTAISKSGLFSQTAIGSTVKNLRVENSYFCDFTNENSFIGGVAGRGEGNFENIYCNAIIETSGQYSGGIVGWIDSVGAHQFTNCWFDGKVVTSHYSVGGILGGATHGQISLTNCLNSGTIISTLTSDASGWVGGLIGYLASPASPTILEDCLNTGNINVEATKRVGTIIGGSRANITFIDVYTMNTITNANGSTIDFTNGMDPGVGTHSTNEDAGVTPVWSGCPVLKTEDDLKGTNAYLNTELSFYSSNNTTGDWAARTDKTPVLKAFSSEYVDVANVKKPIVIGSADTSWMVSGGGTQDNPYIIADAADLLGLVELSAENNFSGQYIRLANDITLNDGNAQDWANTPPAFEWTPIGRATAFAGTFDGDGHAIKGLYTRSTAQFTGFFGKTALESTVKNLRVENSYFCDFTNKNSLIGGVAGRGEGNFENIYCNAIIETSGEYSGGIVGWIDSVGAHQFTNCWFDGKAVTSSYSVGGILGGATHGQISLTNCLNSGTIISTLTSDVSGWVGGLIGYLAGAASPTILEDCLNTGNINVKATKRVGTIIGGSRANITFIDVYTMNTITNANGSTIDFTNGMDPGVGTHSTNEDAGVTPVWSGCPVLKTEDDLKGTNAYLNTELSFYSSNNTTGDWAARTDKTPVLKAFSSEYVDVANVKKPIVIGSADTSWMVSGGGTQDNPYIIADAADLLGLVELSAENNFSGQYIRLANDITLNDGNAQDWANTPPAFEWTPIGRATAFAGTFDGDGHTIKGLYTKNLTQYAGFFGKTASGSMVKNLRIENSYFYCAASGVNTFIGSFAGRGEGNFENVYSNAYVVADGQYAGGIVGWINDAAAHQLTNCCFDGQLTSTSYYAGGILGGGLGGPITLKNCINSGTIISTMVDSTWGAYVGGIIGYLSGGASLTTLEDCINSGEVRVKDIVRVGAIIGHSRANLKFVNVFYAKDCLINVDGKTITFDSGSNPSIGSFSNNEGPVWTGLPSELTP